MSQTRLAVAVVMERTPLEDNRWQSEKWEPIGVVPDSSEPGAAPRALLENEARAQWLHPGFKLELFHCGGMGTPATRAPASSRRGATLALHSDACVQR